MALLAALAVPVCADDTDFLALAAYDSEIKAIAKVIKVQRMSSGRHGTFTLVTFRRVYATTPYTPKNFVGACNTMLYSWQTRSKDTVYYKPKVGHKVYVTVSTDGGAITSYTFLNEELDRVVRNEPNRVDYHRGKAVVQRDEY